MALSESGGGRLLSNRQLRAQRAELRLDLPGAIDLNRARPAELAAHPYIGKRLAKSIVALRRRHKIRTPVDLAQGIRLKKPALRRLQQTSFGNQPVRPLVVCVSATTDRVHAGEEVRHSDRLSYQNRCLRGSPES